MIRATPKQVAYALRLMGLAGFSTTWMRAEHKRLGASMRERSGRVEDWLASRTRSEISRLIDKLEELADAAIANRNSSDSVAV